MKHVLFLIFFATLSTSLALAKGNPHYNKAEVDHFFGFGHFYHLTEAGSTTDSVDSDEFFPIDLSDETNLATSNGKEVILSNLSSTPARYSLQFYVNVNGGEGSRIALLDGMSLATIPSSIHETPPGAVAQNFSQAIVNVLPGETLQLGIQNQGPPVLLFGSFIPGSVGVSVSLKVQQIN